MKTSYEKNKAAKVGEMITCPVCGEQFKKKQYAQAFCSRKCKDDYWNNLGDRHTEHNEKKKGSISLSSPSPVEDFDEFFVTRTFDLFARQYDVIIKEAFLEHFGFAITEVKDRENLCKLSSPESSIYSFLYRGETFLYYQEGYIDIKRNEEMFDANIYSKFMKV